ncbi:hypothetical protein IRJ41_005406 [Triplophysa rosa]|uniref:Uncharacterized protein n=1 Tax=Triplophysa rosa TaxID=992332 RepID=A0A9W7W956_TRIRA|nr:hypothetical protein IRJ41_005406 [Triplophysa rosa]
MSRIIISLSTLIRWCLVLHRRQTGKTAEPISSPGVPPPRRGIRTASHRTTPRRSMKQNVPLASLSWSLYKVLISTSTQTFCCLADINSSIAPSHRECQILALSGLGYKKLVLVCISGTFDELNSQLQNAYHALKNVHGYKFMRCSQSQHLIDIPIPNAGYSIPYLKGQRGLNKATEYIVPVMILLHHDVVKEVCQQHSRPVPLFDLEKHIQQMERSVIFIVGRPQL